MHVKICIQRSNQLSNNDIQNGSVGLGLSVMSGLRLGTVKKCSTDLDSLGEWLRYDEESGCVTRVYCELCSKHSDKLKSLRNFSPAFVGGVTGSALKKDKLR